MDLRIKLFGEHNTATRAVKQMLSSTDGVTLINSKHPDEPGNVDIEDLKEKLIGSKIDKNEPLAPGCPLGVPLDPRITKMMPQVSKMERQGLQNDSLT